MWWSINNQLMRHRILSKVVLNMTRVLSGVSASCIANEQGTVGLLPDVVIRSESDTFNLPCDDRLRDSYSETGQGHIFLVGRSERIIKGGNPCWNYKIVN